MHGSIQRFELASRAWLEERGIVRRKLQMYLPPSYLTATERRYPVLYMHYGQHIFAPNDREHETWKVQETVERLLADSLIEEVIIVGIVAARETISADFWHYESLYDWQVLGGAAYERFIVDELKPWVDQNFRTLADREHTAILGASAGGVVSFNIAQNQPTCFGKVGMLSPVLRSQDHGRWLVGDPLRKPSFTLWVDVGEAEGVYTAPVREFVERLLALGLQPEKKLFYYLEEGAAHLDSFWSKRMIHPLLLFFGKRGKALTAELQGENQLGVESAPLLINPVVTFDSGFKLSVLAGAYRVADEQILRAESAGRLYGGREGETALTFHYQEVETTRSYQVIEKMADTVRVCLRAYAPVATSPYTEIYLETLALQRVEDQNGKTCRYEGEYVLPRGFTLKANFACGMRAFESLATGETAPLREFRATRDGIFEYTIEGWPKDLSER